MGGYTFLTTAITIDNYINGCLQLFLKNNWKIILWFTIFSYICQCNPIINNQNNIEMAIDNRKKDGRGKPLTGTSGITRWKKYYEMGGKHDKVVDGVRYRDRAKNVR